jgi:hypothetical protein
MVWVSVWMIPLSRGGETTQVPAVQVTPEQADQPATDSGQDPRDNRKTPLTPEEEMQRQIRLFDPLDKSGEDRTGGDRTAPAGNAGRSDRSTAQPGSRESANGDITGDTTGSNVAVAPGDARLPGYGPRVSGDETGSQAGEYTGPAVLSRSYSINTLAVPTDLKWHETVSLSDVYDTSSARALPGVPTPGGSSGASAAWSFGGNRVTRNDLFGFAYGGGLTVYGGGGSLNGLNQQFTLTYSHLFTRRLTFSAVDSGSFLSANYALQNPIPAAGATLANANLAVSPNLEPTDSSTKQFNSQMSLNWQQSARLSFNISTAYFAIVRSGAGLVGATGTQAQGGVNYRYSSRTTVGLYYSYGHNQYPQGLGSSDSTSAGLIYSFALNRTTHLSVRGGISSTEAIAETQVLLPPLVAFLLGTTTGIADVYHKNSTSEFSGSLAKSFGRNVSAALAIARGTSPGNGVLLTSTQQSISASMSAKFLRVYSLQLSAVNQSLTSIGQALSRSFRSDIASITVSRSYRSGLSVNFAVSYSYFGSHDPTLLPYQMHVSSGVSWTPAHLKIWPF